MTALDGAIIAQAVVAAQIGGTTPTPAKTNATPSGVAFVCDGST